MAVKYNATREIKYYSYTVKLEAAVKEEHDNYAIVGSEGERDPELVQANSRCQ